MLPRYYVTYDSRDPTDATVCRILDGFGRKRSEIVKAMIHNAASRYSWEVLEKKNVNVLLYLLKTDVRGFAASESPPACYPQDTVPVVSERKSISNTPASAKEEPMLFPDETAQVQEKKQYAPETSEPVNTPLQTPADQTDAEQLRRNLVNFLSNGFYTQEGAENG